MTRRPVLIDTDAGVDDALALLLALRSPEIAVHLVTTVAGNVEVERCTRNVKAVIGKMHLQMLPDTVQGASSPMKLPLLTASEVHGPGGLGSLTSRRVSSPDGTHAASRAIVAMARKYSRKLTIVALGPLTNIAQAVQLDRRAMQGIGQLISMGGAFRVPGNTGPVAEFNYYVDPHAVATVLKSGMNTLIVPLDVTQRVVLTWKQFCTSIAHLPAKRRNWFHGLLDGYLSYHHSTEGRIAAYMHDPVALAGAIRPGLLTSFSSGVDIETASGPARGMTSLTSSPRMKVRVATNVDRTAWNTLASRIWH